MSDFFKDVFRSLEEREANPFIGSLFISFCLFNWRFLVVLFDGGLSSLQKITEIERIAFCWDYPVSSAVAYVVLSPVVSWLLFVIQNGPRAKHRKAIVTANHEVERERLKGEIRIEQLKLQLVEQRQQSEVASDDEIKRLSEATELSFAEASVVTETGIRNRKALREAGREVLTRLSKNVPSIWTVASRFGNVAATEKIDNDRRQERSNANRKQHFESVAKQLNVDIQTAMHLTEARIDSVDLLRDLKIEELEKISEDIPNVVAIAAAVGNEGAEMAMLRQSGAEFKGPNGTFLKLRLKEKVTINNASSPNLAIYRCKFWGTNTEDRNVTVDAISAVFIDSNGTETTLGANDLAAGLSEMGGSTEVTGKSVQIEKLVEPITVQSVSITTMQDDTPLVFKPVT
jgi:hypothetical protein